MSQPAAPYLSRRSSAWLAIGLLTMVSRLVALPLATERTLLPDGAHFLNIARCFARGEGFSTTEAWPAWIPAQRLPMPETEKEPGYSFLIAGLMRMGADPFRAGQAISLLAGLALPFVAYALGRRTSPDPTVATIAGLLVAASPLVITKSVSVLVESVFALLIALTFLSALARREGLPRTRSLGLDALTGLLFGLAWLMRAQTLLALPALLALLAFTRPRRELAPAIAVAALAALAALSPLVLRNLRLFGVPFYSNVTWFGMLAYMDPNLVNHGQVRPPSPFGFALHHVPEVARHVGSSLWGIAHATLPREVLGNLLWLPVLAWGVWLSLRDWKTWTFALLYAFLTVAFISVVHWDSYYFTSSAVMWCLLVALGAADLMHRLRSRTLGVALALLLAVSFGFQIRAACRALAFAPPAVDGARHEAAFMRSHLTPREALLADDSAYWAWFCDRPAVHLPVGDTTAFLATLRRLDVRWAALPTHRLAELATYYPSGTLPSVLVPDHSDPLRDVTVFRIVDPAAAGRGN